MSRKIVITGASSAIGQAISKKVLKAGDQLVLQCFNHPEKCIHLQRKNDINCKIVTSDFNDHKSVDDFCKQLSETDILINAAASTITGLLPHYSEKDILEMLYVNIYALTRICQTVIPSMLVKRAGIIINISSVAATRGNKGQTIYAGTKGFMESFSRSLTAEYGSKGIRVNCIAPGPIDSGSLKELMSYASDEVKNSVISNRLGTAEDVASLVTFLCDNTNSFINGTCFHVDGGFMRGI